MKKRSLPYFCGVLSALFVICLAASSCGKNFYFAGRNLPPSKVLNRVLIAEQNPSALASGGAALHGCLLRHPSRLQHLRRSFHHYRLLRQAAPHHSEPAGTTGGRGLQRGRRQPDPDQLRAGKGGRHQSPSPAASPAAPRTAPTTESPSAATWAMSMRPTRPTTSSASSIAPRAYRSR